MSNLSNKRKTGREKEELAAKYLEDKGYHILERNFFSNFGEIDIIAKDRNTLVFAEVKYRKNESWGNPLEAVNLIKQKRICNTALYYLFRRHLSENTPCRFDVIAIMGEEIIHVENAFEFCKKG